MIYASNGRLYDTTMLGYSASYVVEARHNKTFTARRGTEVPRDSRP